MLRDNRASGLALSCLPCGLVCFSSACWFGLRSTSTPRPLGYRFRPHRPPLLNQHLLNRHLLNRYLRQARQHALIRRLTTMQRPFHSLAVIARLPAKPAILAGRLRGLPRPASVATLVCGQVDRRLSGNLATTSLRRIRVVTATRRVIGKFSALTTARHRLSARAAIAAIMMSKHAGRTRAIHRRLPPATRATRPRRGRWSASIIRKSGGLASHATTARFKPGSRLGTLPVQMIAKVATRREAGSRLGLITRG
jgi:hypothetical protein